MKLQIEVNHLYHATIEPPTYMSIDTANKINEYLGREIGYGFPAYDSEYRKLKTDKGSFMKRINKYYFEETGRKNIAERFGGKIGEFLKPYSTHGEYYFEFSHAYKWTPGTLVKNQIPAGSMGDMEIHVHI